MKALERDRAAATRRQSNWPLTSAAIFTMNLYKRVPRVFRIVCGSMCAGTELVVAVVVMLAAFLVAFAVVQSIQLRKIRRERDRADRIAEFMTEIFKVSDPWTKIR